MPKVTVLMPTYNVAPWVKEAIRSVLMQTYTDFELLVIDDSSTDDTVAVVRGIDDPRIRLVQNDRNLGLADNLNRGLAMVGTEFVARMDGDDIALPHWLASEVAVLDAHPDVGVCGGGGQRFGTSQSTIRFPEGHDDIAANMLFECSIIVPTMRMSVVREHGLRYRSDAFPAEDYRFWADSLSVTRLHNVADTLFRYRMHETQICSSRRDEQEIKVTAVRRHMLRWLDDSLDDSDADYYCRRFVQRTLTDSRDLREREAFARRLLAANSRSRRIAKAALRARLGKHLQLALYQTAIDNHFANGYSPARYADYLCSGMALKAGWRYETKFLAKSLLGRKE